MTFDRDKVAIDAEGTHKRQSVCLALVGNPEVSISWAVSAMELQFPPNAKRGLLVFPHPNLDVARNFAIDQWRRSGADMRTEWLCLLPAEDPVTWDVMPRLMSLGHPVSRASNTFMIHSSVIEKTDAPWFKDGEWQGLEKVVLVQGLVQDQSIFTPGPISTTEESAEQMICVCVPSLGKTSLIWVGHIIQLSAPVASTRSLAVMVGYEVGDARQRLTQMVIDMRPKPKYLLFIGDDNLPPPSGLQMIHETIQMREKAKAVSGLYYMKCGDPPQGILWRNTQPGVLQPGRDFKVGDIVEVDGCGLDFVLFETSALAAMPPLRFQTIMKWVEGKGMLIQTEDAFFWDRFRETHGHGPLVDTRCRVGHLDARTNAFF